MNNDYLWDGTGSDPEIEQLERSLGVFKHASSDSPMPSTPKSNPRRKVTIGSFQILHTRFVLASAICLAFVLLIGLGVWLQLTEVTPKDVIADRIIRDKRSTAPANAHRSAIPVSEPARIPVRQAPPVRFASVQQIGPRTEIRKKRIPSEILTKDELYAYNQLMTALSITRTNLRLVKDRVDGIEN